MMAVIGFASYMVKGYVDRYFLFDIRTEIRYEEKVTTPLPAIVFCLESLWQVSTYCYKDKSFVNDTPCNKSTTQSTSLQYYNSMNAQWKAAKYIGDGCHVINDIGYLNLTSTSALLTKFQAPNTMGDKVYVYTLSVTEYQTRGKKIPFLTDNLKTVPAGKHEIYAFETEISRLKYPYPADCTNQKLSPNPLSKSYSPSSCLENCFMNELLRECGDIPDIYHEYYRKVERPLTNMSNDDTRNCLFGKLFDFNQVNCDCPLSCSEMEYKTRVDTYQSLQDNNTWNINILLEDSKVTIIRQVPDYTIEELLGSIGGIIGLAVGASSLSMMEFVVYFGLNIVRKVHLNSLRTQ